MRACTAQLLRGDDAHPMLLTNESNASPERAPTLRKRKRQSVGEVRAFLAACHEEANRIFNLIISKVQATVTEGEGEVFIHEGVANGEIEPDGGGGGEGEVGEDSLHPHGSSGKVGIF
ncbi:hypothetical protein CYMTET_24563 [Cymbomonas tetramitiformis]|uniref:Uncharacterized protein n=1 Tax=Cymbomonas tetramitiformis TaxID=36881 RepID=A0AAE0FWC6_9CHLO|nr:hypothetical protein CYMTET_24563 [Cymbomonas tetramitiformis]